MGYHGCRNQGPPLLICLMGKLGPSAVHHCVRVCPLARPCQHKHQLFNINAVFFSLSLSVFLPSVGYHGCRNQGLPLLICLMGTWPVNHTPPCTLVQPCKHPHPLFRTDDSSLSFSVPLSVSLPASPQLDITDAEIKVPPLLYCWRSTEQIEN